MLAADYFEWYQEGKPIMTDREMLELIALKKQSTELLEALKAYRKARAMPSYGDYAEIDWEYSAGPMNSAWGGGDCTKHGRWYGRCHLCFQDLAKLRAQADRDAVHARDNALRAADELARAAIAKAEKDTQS
jgi:hypothetical protein